MHVRTNALRDLFFGRPGLKTAAARRPRNVVLSCDTLEGRVTPSSFGNLHHAIAVTASATNIHHHNSGGTGTGTSTTSAAVTAAQTTLNNDIQTIELKSGTTVGQLTAIRVAFSTLRTDGLSPTSASALSTFEDSLVSANANQTTMPTLAAFEALYTTTPTTTQTTDLTAAYNALTAAVTSSNITASDITTINNDWLAVQTAQGVTSTPYPYFNLVTGHTGGRGSCH